MRTWKTSRTPIRPSLSGAARATTLRTLRSRRLNFEPLESRTLLNATPPNDPLFDEQWHHQTMETPDAWGALQPEWGGEGVVVAVLDSGVDYRHEDLNENIWINEGEIPGYGTAGGLYNDLTDVDGDTVITFRDLELDGPNSQYVEDANENGRIDGADLLEDDRWADLDDEPGDANDLIDDLIGWNFLANNKNPIDIDSRGHGTGVSGAVAAETNNGTGIAGVAGDALIMPLRVFSDENAGEDSSGVTNAITYAGQMDAQIASFAMRLPGPGANWGAFRDAMDETYVFARWWLQTERVAKGRNPRRTDRNARPFPGLAAVYPQSRNLPRADRSRFAARRGRDHGSQGVGHRAATGLRSGEA